MQRKGWEKMTGEIHGHCGEAARSCEQGRSIDDGPQRKHACSQPVWHQSPKTTHSREVRQEPALT